MVNRGQCVEMSHGGASRDTPVQHGFYVLDFEHTYFEPERCRGLVVVK